MVAAPSYTANASNRPSLPPSDDAAVREGLVAGIREWRRRSTPRIPNTPPEARANTRAGEESTSRFLFSRPSSYAGRVILPRRHPPKEPLRPPAHPPTRPPAHPDLSPGLRALACCLSVNAQAQGYVSIQRSEMRCRRRQHQQLHQALLGHDVPRRKARPTFRISLGNMSACDTNSLPLLPGHTGTPSR